MPNAAKPKPSARLRFGTWAEFARFLTQDTTQHGLFVRASSPLPVGTELTLRFVLPDESEIDLAARVTHQVTTEQSAKPGMGVQFTHMSAEQAAQLQELMSHTDLTRSIHQVSRAIEEPAPPPVRPSSEAEKLDHRLLQAMAQLERSRFEAAERQVMDVLSDDPSDKSARSLLLVIQARRLRSQFDFERAIEKYRALLKLDPQNLEARQQLAALESEIQHSKALFHRVFGSEDTK